MIRFPQFSPAGRILVSLMAAAVLACAGFNAGPASAQGKKPEASSKPKPGDKTKPKPGNNEKPKPTAGGPALLGSFGEWGAYTAQTGKAKTCYALGKPKERLPASLKRDPGYVFISNRPGEGVKNEVSIVMGFDVKPDSAPKAEVSGNAFDMIAKGANLWVRNPAEEGQFIDALRKGQRLVVKATSKKGNAVTDTYPLTGILPALDRIGKECQ